MEKDFESKINGSDVSGYVEGIRERNQMVYNEEMVLCEAGECEATMAHMMQTIEASIGNPGAARASSQLRLAESSLYWANQYKEEGEWARAAEQISFARIQLMTAKEELGWGSQWSGNT